jgi:hypothetical protein
MFLMRSISWGGGRGGVSCEGDQPVQTARQMPAGTVGIVDRFPMIILTSLISEKGWRSPGYLCDLKLIHLVVLVRCLQV